MDKQKTSPLIRFLGGKDLYFILGALLLISIIIYVYDKINFIFEPLLVIFSTLTLPIILAIILYYPLNPIVNYLENKFKLKRIWGTLIVFIILFASLIALFAFILPIIWQQIVQFAEYFPQFIKTFSDDLNHLSKDSTINHLVQQTSQWVNQHIAELPSKIVASLGSTLNSMYSIITKVTYVGTAIITAPFVLFFMLKDRGAFMKFTDKIIPPAWHKPWHTIVKDINLQVGTYIQGQVTVSLCIGLLLYIGYLIIDLKYAVALACIAAVTSVVPYIGPFIACIPAMIIAYIDSPLMLIKMLVVWGIVQFLEGNFISPNIIGKNLKMHPLTIMFVLLVAGNLMGIVGMIIGIPLFAILRVLMIHLLQTLQIRYNQIYSNQPKITLYNEHHEKTVTKNYSSIKQKIKHIFIIDDK